MLFAPSPYPIVSIEKARHVLIVDCANLAHRFWHAKAFVGLTNEKGQRSGHVYGFVKSVISHIRRVNSPVALVYALEGGRQKRQEIYQDYKGTRDREHTGDPMPDVTAVVRCMPGYTVRMEGWEADDAIASVVKIIRKEDIAAKARGMEPRKVHILSADRDLWQLISRNVVCWTSADECISTKEVRRNLGIRPCHVVVYKALFGDHSDNIGGVRGLPRKKVVKVLLNTDGSPEQFMKAARKSLPSKMMQRIAENSEVIARNIELVRLRRHKVSMVQNVASHPALRSLLVKGYGCHSLEEDIKRMFREA